MNKIKIPSKINLDRVFDGLDNESSSRVRKSKTEIINIKDATLILIHILTPDWRYFEETKEHNYFKGIDSRIFNDEFGKTFSDVKRILMDENYPIIETDGKKYYEGKSTRYKLVDEFFYDSTTVMVGGHGSKYIRKYYSNINERKNRQFIRLGFLRDKLTSRITIDSTVNDFIATYFQEFEDKVSCLNSKEYDVDALRNLIKILRVKFTSDLKDISRGIYGESESETCHRFTSVFSGLKKELRPFIKIDGEDTMEVDIKSSQPYFLNQIVKSEFYLTKGEDSLYSIFPELYKEINNSKNLIKVTKSNFNYVWGNPFIINPTQFNLLRVGKSKSILNKFISKYSLYTKVDKYKSVTDNLNDYSSLGDYIKSYFIPINKTIYYLYFNISTLLHKGVPFLPYICGNSQNLTDLWEFRRIPYKFGFYEFLVSELNNKYDRDFIKSEMMSFLNNKNNRNYKFLNDMRRMFPNLNGIIEFYLRFKFSENFNSEKYKNPFSLLLQRVESYYFLQVGVKSFCEHYPSEPVITIHDSVIVRKSMRQQMEHALRRSIEPGTGLVMGVDSKNVNPYERIPAMIEKSLQTYRITK